MATLAGSISGSGRRFRVASVLAGLWLGAYLAATEALPSTRTWQIVVGDGVYVVPLYACTLLAGWVAFRSRGAERRFWLLTSLFALLWSAGDSLYGIYDGLAGTVPGSPSAADVLDLASYLPLFPALWIAFRPRSFARLSLGLLDAFLTAAALTAAEICLIIRPELRQGLTVATLTNVGYPLFDLAVLTLLASLALAGRTRPSLTTVLVGAAFAAAAVTDSAYTYLSVVRNFQADSITNLGWQVEALLLVLAAVRALDGHGVAGARPHRREVQRDSGLPIALIATVLAALAIVFDDPGARADSSTMVTVALLVGGIVFRLLVTERDLRRAQRAEAERSQRLEEMVEARTASLRASHDELRGSREASIRRLSKAVGYRDEETGGHIERIAELSQRLARAFGQTEEFCALLAIASPLLEIVKIATPDAILQKPGRLTAEERTVIEQHAQIGYELLQGSGEDVLELAASIALTHHERWDGSGYPHRLAGTEIPLEGRIVAVCDVYDALSSDRCYRPALPHAEVLRIMDEGRGSHFDPQLLDCFLAQLHETTGGSELPTAA
jgi:putative two-component system response regulator